METRDNKKILSETLAELAEIVWKNIFEFDEKTFNRNVEPLLERSLRLLMLFFMAGVEEKMLETVFWKCLQIKYNHTTLKFTAEYSKKEVNLLDLNIKLIDGELKTNLSVPILNTAKRVYLTVKLNRICSDNENDKRCIDLEKWLMERGYNEKMIRKQILRAGNFREVIFLREKSRNCLSKN